MKRIHRLIQDGVARNFEIIGEATRRLSAHIKQTYPEPPWRQMAGLRDVLIHNYMGVDVNEVWNIVEHELPGLKHAIMVMLDEITESRNNPADP